MARSCDAASRPSPIIEFLLSLVGQITGTIATSRNWPAASRPAACGAPGIAPGKTGVTRAFHAGIVTLGRIEIGILMNIRSAKVDELAQRLARLTGEDVETALERAIEERLSRV